MIRGARRQLVPSRLRSGKELQGHREDDERKFNSTLLALSCTSRQLYQEAASIYYSENTFNFQSHSLNDHLSEHWRMIEEFAAAIGPQNAKSITAVHINTIVANFIPYLTVLSGLRQLTLGLHFWNKFGYQSACYHEFWAPQMNAYVQNHPSVVVNVHKVVWPIFTCKSRVTLVTSSVPEVTVVTLGPKVPESLRSILLSRFAYSCRI